MRGCEKIQLLGEPSVLKILGSTFMEVIAIYLPGPRSCVECDCVCVQKKDMVASEKNDLCVQKKAVCVFEKNTVCTGNKAVCIEKKTVCVLKRGTCVLEKRPCVLERRMCVLERRTCVCVIPSLITGISPKDNFVCSHFFPSTDHLFLQ